MKVYHGTKSESKINKEGFVESAAGGGQMGIKGVFFSTSQAEAFKYAKCAVGDEPPTTMKFDLKNLRLIDLRRCSHSTDVWKKLGYDFNDPNGLKFIRSRPSFGPTEILIERGFDGAKIRSSIKKFGRHEVVVFDPKTINVEARTIGRRLLFETT